MQTTSDSDQGRYPGRLPICDFLDEMLAIGIAQPRHVRADELGIGTLRQVDDTTCVRPPIRKAGAGKQIDFTVGEQSIGLLISEINLSLPFEARKEDAFFADSTHYCF